MKYSRPSAQTGDALWCLPSRWFQCSLPVSASRQVARPASWTRNSSSPWATGLGTYPAPPFLTCQATCVLVTFPVPSGLMPMTWYVGNPAVRKKSPLP